MFIYDFLSILKIMLKYLIRKKCNFLLNIEKNSAIIYVVEFFEKRRGLSVKRKKSRHGIERYTLSNHP